jgi:hypothetical protein
MGVLLKFILFGLVFYYIVKTIGSFIYKILGGQPQQHQRQTTQNKREGEINVDSKPKNKTRKFHAGSKEGDYIDYEEVK